MLYSMLHLLFFTMVIILCIDLYHNMIGNVWSCFISWQMCATNFCHLISFLKRNTISKSIHIFLLFDLFILLFTIWGLWTRYCEIIHQILELIVVLINQNNLRHKNGISTTSNNMITLVWNITYICYLL